MRHGLEPQAQGGSITVKARRSGDKLDIEIADTGAGMSEIAVPGVGLSNVRARLQGLYADRAQFLLQPNQPRGLKIKLLIPIDPPAQPAA